MSYKLHHHKFSWCAREHWLLPKDEGMYQGLFNFVEENIERTMAHIAPSRRRACIQAGGAMGIWPLCYARFFDLVITFEPLHENVICLQHNINGAGNILWSPFALSDETGFVEMQYTKSKKNSYGAHWAKPTQDGIQAVTIDELQVQAAYPVDHIQLDVEGYELRILKGGEKTIAAYRPVIVLERRHLPHLHHLGVKANDAVRWLEKNYGYRIVDEFRGDVVMVP